MSDLKTVLIEDARLSQISDEITFGVSSGANQSSYQQFTAVSSSASSVVYNVIVPSEAVAIDKNIQLRQTINLTFRVSGVPASSVAWSYGILDSFQAFPFNSLMTTCNATINNAAISTNVRDVLPSLVRMCDSRDLQRYRGLCPCLPDSMYANLCETYQLVKEDNGGVVSNSDYWYLPNPDSQLGNGLSAGLDTNFAPRGAFPLEYLKVDHYKNGVLQAGGSLVSTDETDYWIIEVSTTTTEPFMALSPFTSNMFSTNQGALIGINNMNFNINIDSSCSRVWSTGNYYIDFSNNKVPFITSITLGNTHSGGLAFTNNQLLLNFLTLQPHQYAHIKSKNVLPYYDTPRYLSNLNQNSSVAGAGALYNAAGHPVALIGASADITSTSLQLNIVPDYLVITVRKPMANQNITDPNGFLVVNKMSLSFNNSQGLLSQMTQQDLWRMSVRNGSSQSWEEFSGKRNMTQGAMGSVIENSNYPQALQAGQNWTTGTCGSLIVISPNDLNLPDFLAGSSLGQFQVFFQMNITNQFFEDIVPEICVIAVNSGTFTTIQGQSIFNTGILTKQSVLDAKQQAPVDKFDTAEYARLVGGHGMDEKPLSALKNLVHRFKKRHSKLEAGHASGGATSGGHMSGGRMGKYL
jgi:hypothetical protein